jgi:CHASE3 domain sensor protein
MSPATAKTLRLLAWSMVLTVLLAAILTAAIVWLVQRQHVAQGWVGQSRVVHRQIERLFNDVQRMESSQRAYLFTGRDDYHDDFRKMERVLPALIDETARLVAGSPRQQETFAGLREVLVRRAAQRAP